jgi:hypothetical protein
VESAELKNQRLKEVFQSKIQEFRKACYTLTGYQVDVTTEGQYRLTSQYAEHKADCLVFKVGPALPPRWLAHTECWHLSAERSLRHQGSVCQGRREHTDHRVTLLGFSPALSLCSHQPPACLRCVPP